MDAEVVKERATWNKLWEMNRRQSEEKPLFQVERWHEQRIGVLREEMALPIAKDTKKKKIES